MASLPTVLVVAPGGGHMLINQRDFDPLTHQRYDEYLSDAAQAGADASGKGSADTSSLPSDFGKAVADGLAVASGFIPAALEGHDSTVAESPSVTRTTRLMESHTLPELREQAKAFGLKGLARANERTVAEAIAEHQLKLEADHVSH